MSEIVVMSPELQKAIQKKSNDKANCINAYMELVHSLESLPVEALVSGAIDFHNRVPDDQFGNTWLQALYLKDKEAAEAVQEMIENSE